MCMCSYSPHEPCMLLMLYRTALCCGEYMWFCESVRLTQLRVSVHESSVRLCAQHILEEKYWSAVVIILTHASVLKIELNFCRPAAHLLKEHTVVLAMSLYYLLVLLLNFCCPCYTGNVNEDTQQNKYAYSFTFASSELQYYEMRLFLRLVGNRPFDLIRFEKYFSMSLCL